MLSKLFKLALALIVLVIVAVALLLWNINPILEKLRPQITKAISQQIKEDVELGSISAQFFPNMGIKISDVALKNKKDLASVGSLILDTSLTDLLKGNIKVNQIALSQVSLKITRERGGSLSLAGISLAKNEVAKPQITKKSKSTRAKESAGSEVKSEKTSLTLEIDQISAKDINIYFTDNSLSPAQKLNITDLNFEARELSADGKGSFSLVANLLGTSAQNFKISGTSKSDKTALGLPKANLILALQDLDLQKIKSLANAYGIKVADLQLDNTAEITISAETSDGGFNVKTNFDATKSNIALAKNFVKTTGLPFKINFEAEPNINLSAKVKNAEIELAGILVNSSASISTKAISGSLDIKKLPLADLGKVLPSLSTLNLSGELSGQIETALNLESGNLPKINADLSLQNISVATLSEISGTLKAANDTATNKIALDLNPAKISGLAFGPSSVRADLSEENFTFSDLSTAIFDGRLSGKGSLATPLTPQTFSSSFSLNDLNLEKLSISLFPNSPYQLKGTLKSLTTNPSADLSRDLISNLTLNLDALAQGGSLAGANILKQTLEKVNSIPGVQAALTKYVPEKLSSLLSKEETAFDKVEITASVKEKVIALSKLILTHEVYQIAGSGTANFDGSLNLLAKLVLTEDISKQIALKEAKMKLLFDSENRITIPISIKKSATGKPIVLPDIGDLTKRAIQNTAKEALTRELQKGGASKIGGTASKALNSLFK